MVVLREVVVRRGQQLRLDLRAQDPAEHVGLQLGVDVDDDLLRELLLLGVPTSLPCLLAVVGSTRSKKRSSSLAYEVSFGS